MKKFLIASWAACLCATLPWVKTRTSASASPSPSPGRHRRKRERVVVPSQEMDITREIGAKIAPSLGATRYTVGPSPSQLPSGRLNAPFNQTMLRFPCVVASICSAASRASAANTQIYNTVSTTCSIRKVFLVFRQSDTLRGQHFADYWRGAEFGFRKTGVIDIHTKNGGAFQQGDASVYGGASTPSCRVSIRRCGGEDELLHDRELPGRRYWDRKSDGHRQPDPRRHRTIDECFAYSLIFSTTRPIRLLTRPPGGSPKLQIMRQARFTDMEDRHWMGQA